MKELLEITTKPSAYRAQPLKRVEIPKPGSTEKRPLGIPTLIDRAVQAVYLFAVDPVVEAKSDKNSYGFRKHRSTHDAVAAVRHDLDKKTAPNWVLEADISKCFDRISHDFLMEHTPICDKSVLHQWLKSGVMKGKILEKTEDGTPQGGIISPTLCNITLNGLEKEVALHFPNFRGISAGVHLVRYADDVVVTGKNEAILKKSQDCN